MRRIAFLAALLLAYGCGSPPKPVETKPNAAGCCARYSDFTFEPLPLGKEVKLTVSEASPVFNFAGGASHFVALRIPQEFDKGTFIVRSHPERSSGLVPSYFFPAVTFLDERHGELATLSDERFAFSSYGFGGEQTFVAQIPVPAGARYAVIHTPRNKVGTQHAVSAEVPSNVIVGPALIPLPDRRVTKTPRLGPTGSVTASLLPPGQGKAR